MSPPAEVAPAKFASYWRAQEKRRQARESCEGCREMAELRRRLVLLELAVWKMAHGESA